MIQVTTGSDEPIIATLFGDAGMGKTSLAATFPNPIFMQAEKGLRAHKNIARLPHIETSAQLFEQMAWLLDSDHDYKTVVIDTVTSLEQMRVAEVVDQDPKANSIVQAAGGYGAGRDLVAGMHARVRKFAELAKVERGMHVIFLAHATVANFQPPDADSYHRYELALHEKSCHWYVNDVDLVGFVQLKTNVLGDEGTQKRAISRGDRILVCHAVANNVSKNRLDIDKPLPFEKGTNPLADYI